MSTHLRIPPEFDSATSEQRIAFIQELWDRIELDPEQAPIPLEHQRLLEERLNEYRDNPRPGQAWNAVRDQLLVKLRGL